ncbi:GDSL-type esterase/lipase family protein [Spirillospora sp. NPDC048911]|uniref:GDSL-type esterase/lipase family protein n=1 Tax=Spirillospora sp. NPDC048911 TaxID=3364527 RepID=UPI00371DCB1B
MHDMDVPLPSCSVRLRGALDLERTPAGWMPRRLPSWTRPQLPDAFCEMVVSQPSGVRLVFGTEATSLELTVLITRTWFAGDPDAEPAGCFDLVVDGEPAGRVPAPDGGVLVLDLETGAVRRENGLPDVVRFGLPPGFKEVEIWLPQSSQVELVDLRADAPVHPPEPGDRPVWIHHGSSISHCADADGPLGSWPVVAARRAGVEVLNLGLGGNAMLDPFTARTIRDLPADLISLKLGINVVNGATMRLRAFVPAVHGFLDTVRDGHPDAPLLLVSPVACPIVETRPGPTGLVQGADGWRFTASGDPADIAADIAAGALSLTVIRDVLRGIAAERSDPNLHYLDGRELFGPADVADLPDDLHPNAAGYRRMGERFAAIAFAGDGPFSTALRSADA